MCCQVYWLPTHQRKWVHDTYPDLILTGKSKELSFDEVVNEHIQVINDDWTTPISLFRRYQKENISIIMFFVNSQFMFNYAWCIGVQHVTTDNCRHLANVPANTLHQVKGLYHDVVVCIDCMLCDRCVAAGGIVGITL